MRRLRAHWKGLLAGTVVVIAVLAVGIPYVYIHLVEGSQPAPLALSDVPSGSTTNATSSGSTNSGGVSGDVTGTWSVSTGSEAGYRVHETLAGQSTTAVGRTSKVTGSLTLQASTVTAASFTVQVADITSDRSQRDAQFSGRIMDTAQYPTASFTLTKPIALLSVPAIGKTISARATGTLTMHGTSRPVSFALEAKRTASSIAVTGDIVVSYGAYNIDNPSFGGFVSVGDSGTVEFLLVTTRAA